LYPDGTLRAYLRLQLLEFTVPGFAVAPYPSKLIESVSPLSTAVAVPAGHPLPVNETGIGGIVSCAFA
jgi:hypothetical protein